MYSRIPHTPRWGGSDIRREPSYRRGDGLPPNYSGTAFQVNPAAGDIVNTDAIAESLPRRPEDDNTPRFDGLPRASRLPTTAPTASVSMIEGTATDRTLDRAEDSDESAVARGGLSSLLDGRHFPLGHGIGYEEMLLLGLIFFLAKEGDGEGDLNETLLLLGLLLLGG